MAPVCVSMQASTRPAVRLSSSRPRPASTPRLLALPSFAAPQRTLVKRYSSDTGAENDDQLVNEKGEILQGRQEMKTSPMSEDKRAQTPEQGGAPEGDRAVAGQAYQTAGQSDVSSPEAGEKRTGSENQSASELAQQEGKGSEGRAPLQD